VIFGGIAARTNHRAIIFVEAFPINNNRFVETEGTGP
jgi:hypothetical protein